jgi:anaerobic magnesium-protoporphyrin IX monomethyl ester cyclase
VLLLKEIVLIEPKTKRGHVYSMVRMPRLGLPLLGAQLKAEGYKVSIYTASPETLPWNKILEADLVGVSTTTSTSFDAYRIASHLRANNIPVVIGGIHATYLPDEALHYADYVVRGEADYTFLPLVRAIKEGQLPRDIPGVSYWDNGVPVHNPAQDCWVEMDDLPIPDLSLFVQGKPGGAIPVMTSRGCPFNCTFCSVTPMFGRGYRYRSTEKVLEELSLYRGQHVFFCDDHFTANPKRTKEVLRGMLDRKINLKGWGAQVRVDAARDEEFLELMRRTRGNIAYIGLESINPATLKAYNKQQSLDDIEEAIRRFHDYGVRIHGMFVFGSDSDTVQTIRDTVDFALKMRIDSVQFLMLTPLPGTPLFKQLESEGRLITKEWDLYDGHHAVFQPALMSPEQLQEESFKAFKRFYSMSHIFQNTMLTGWGSSLYRGVGWWLVKRFEKQNRWYDQILERLQNKSSRSVPLLYRRIPINQEGKLKRDEAANHLKIYVSESNGVFYLRLRGLLNRFALRELNRTLKGLVPKPCLQLVINTEGLSFSEKTARAFTRSLERLGRRVGRVQIIYRKGDLRHSFLKKKSFRIQRFELLPGKER